MLADAEKIDLEIKDLDVRGFIIDVAEMHRKKNIKNVRFSTFLKNLRCWIIW